MAVPEFDVVAAHRHFSVDCFNRVWELLDKPDRTADDDQKMVMMCHASIFHWKHRPDCTSRNLSIGYWQLSRVYAELHQPQNARQYARLCESYSINEEPFFQGYACEAAARAEFLSGNSELAEQLLAQARDHAAEVVDPDDRRLLEQDLETVRPARAASDTN